LYTSFFPGLIYWIFGTSRQISIGTDSIVSLMVSASIQKYSSKFIPPDNFENLFENSTSTKNYLNTNQNDAKILLALAQMFCVAIIYF
jgi:MFS superfamily sulfate permease-like transporter